MVTQAVVFQHPLQYVPSYSNQSLPFLKIPHFLYEIFLQCVVQLYHPYQQQSDFHILSCLRGVPLKCLLFL